MGDTMMTKDLYGGAITVNLESRFVDVSEIRQVPDHQEVYADVNTDQSVIFELLSKAEVADEQAGKYHLDDLVSGEHTVLSDESISSTDCPGVGEGAKRVVTCEMLESKFKEAEKNNVIVFLAVLRMESVETDFIVSMNVPVSINQDSSSAKNALEGGAAVLVGNRDFGTKDAVVKGALDSFKAVLKSLKIVNWGLFG